MVMVFINSVRRWWQAGAALQVGLALSGAGSAVPARLVIAPRRVAPRAPAVARRLPALPLTPFGASAWVRPAPSQVPTRRATRRFWMTLDPQDRRHAALGGSFAEVCAALEQLAASEERRL